MTYWRKDIQNNFINIFSFPFCIIQVDSLLLNICPETSQMTNCGKNIIYRLNGLMWTTFFALTKFWCHLWFITEQTHNSLELIIINLRAICFSLKNAKCISFFRLPLYAKYIIFLVSSFCSTTFQLGYQICIWIPNQCLWTTHNCIKLS